MSYGYIKNHKIVLYLHMFQHTELYPSRLLIYPFQNLSLGIILKIFIKFHKFQPQYSYKTYSYKKKSVLVLTVFNTICISSCLGKICDFNVYLIAHFM